MRQLSRLTHWIEHRIMRYLVPTSVVQAGRRRPLVGHKGWRR